jgi:putative flippase GtrA
MTAEANEPTPVKPKPAGGRAARLAKFAGVGMVNTLGTFVLYQALLFFMDYRIAYSISFSAGIVFSVFANSRLVFGSRVTIVRFVLFAAFNIMSFLLGLGLLVLLVDYLHTPSQIAPIVMVIAMFPLNYYGARMTIGRVESPAGHGNAEQSADDPLSGRTP